MAFQPAASACCDASAARKVSETADAEPSAGAHSSSASVMLSVSGAVSSALCGADHLRRRVEERRP